MRRVNRWAPRSGWIAVACLGASALVGCNGPKDSCDGTLDSYASEINGQDFDDMVELYMPDQRAKYSDRKLAAVMKQNWFGSKNYKWTYMQADVDKSGKLCIARTVCRWDTKIRGQKEESTEDFSDVYTLHLQADGKWYMDVPGSQKLEGY